MHRGVLVPKPMRHSYKNRQLTDLLWSRWSQQKATDFPQRPWVWGMSLHHLCHLQSHQNCWCLCHCWALGPRGQPLPKQWETARKEQVWTAEEKRNCCLIKSFSLINNLMLQLLFHRLLCLHHIKKAWTVVTLTVSDCVEGPQVVFEERVSLDFLHTVSTQPHVPWNTEGMLKSNSLWRAADCSWTCTQNLLCYESN